MNDNVDWVHHDTRTINIDGIEVQTSLTPVELADLPQKYAELQSNWNSLKEWITKENNNYHYGLRSGKTLLYGKFLGRVDVLDKMTELEGRDMK